jgi:hypothetical protein
LAELFDDFRGHRDEGIGETFGDGRSVGAVRHNVEACRTVRRHQRAAAEKED